MTPMLSFIVALLNRRPGARGPGAAIAFIKPSPHRKRGNAGLPLAFIELGCELR
jgi:hypothetical protein